MAKERRICFYRGCSWSYCPNGLRFLRPRHCFPRSCHILENHTPILELLLR